MRKHRTLAERFWSRVDKSPRGCWLWAGPKNSHGYGHLGSGGRGGANVMAHRLSWQMAFGDIPAGLYICHTCDVRLCVNPAHLFLGTQADNMQDAARKGRLPVGESRAAAKLTEEQVHDIRAREADGDPPAVLAAAFGVSRSALQRIVARQSWKHC